MKPRHFWWLFDTAEKAKPGGSLTDEESAELKKMLADATAREAKERV